jgi:hypothetical protein
MVSRQQRKPTLTVRPVSQVTSGSRPDSNYGGARPDSSYKAQQDDERMFDSPDGGSTDPYAQLGALADYQVDQPRPRGFSRAGDEDLLS